MKKGDGAEWEFRTRGGPWVNEQRQRRGIQGRAKRSGAYSRWMCPSEGTRRSPGDRKGAICVGIIL